MGRLNDFPVSKHFRLYEFESKDTREVRLAPDLVIGLQRLRDLLQRPVIVLSGYRTPEQNAKVGGVAGSAHMKGIAADVTWDGFEMEAAVKLAEQAGFDGIGRYPRKGFIHVDVRGYLARWVEQDQRGGGLG